MLYHDAVVHQHYDVLVVLSYDTFVSFSPDVLFNKLYEIDSGAVGVQICPAEARIDLRKVIFAVFIEHIDIYGAVELDVRKRLLQKAEELWVLKG